jgi:dienelactone hydrolase
MVRLMVAAMTVMLSLVHYPAASLAQSAHQTFDTTAEEVTFQSGEVTLSGTLIKPATAGPHPAVVLVHGSSPNVRGPLLGFATEVFAQHGVAALAYDKRGYGRSSGNPNKNSLYSLADDALAGVRYLESRADIDPKRVGMEGESQGGWIIPIVASRSKDVAFMILVSASGVSPAQSEVFGIETRFRNSGLSERVVDAGRKARKLLDDYLYAVNQGRLPGIDEPDLSLGTDHDPVPALKQLTQPILIFLGTADSHLPAEYSALVFDKTLREAGDQDYTILVYPGAGHGIDLPTNDSQGETSMRRIDSVWPTMTNWVVAHVNGRATRGKGLQGPASDESAAFSESGIYGKPAWYGTATVQLSLIVLFALVFLSAALGLTINAVLSRVRHDRTMPAPAGARRARLLAIVSSALNLIVLVGVIALIAEFLSSGEEVHLAPLFNALPLLSLLATLVTIGMSGFAVLAWKDTYWSLVGRVSYTMLAFVALLFVPFLNYWNLIGFQL